jgi:hypothetical protein
MKCKDLLGPALGAGLTTPPRSPTARSPARITGNCFRGFVFSSHVRKEGDIRSGIRRGLGTRAERVRHSGVVWRPAPSAWSLASRWARVS